MQPAAVSLLSRATRGWLVLLAPAFAACSSVSPSTGPAATPEGGASGDVVNGCHPALASDFVSGTSVTFRYPSYTPPCLVVSPGSKVTFDGSAGGGFAMHPLHAGVAPSLSPSGGQSSAPSPIVETTSGATATFTFSTAGVYPYYCEAHQGSGMYGVVLVK